MPSIPEANRPRLILLLGLSVWCGLVAGLAEVATIVVQKRLFDSNHLYGMSREFIWLIPVTNLAVFLVIGVLGSLVCWARPRHGPWLFWRVVCRAHFAPDRTGRRW